MSTTELLLSLKPVTDGSGDEFLPVGAHVTEAGVVYRVWAPDHEQVSVAIGDGPEPSRQLALAPEGDGTFSGVDPEGRAGDRYWFVIGNQRVPDPASRFQPLGVEAPSEVIDPRVYNWITRGWRPPAFRGRVIYELHVGTFTAEGTFAAAIDRLDALAELGVNAIELMPVAEFAGTRNWGYDGVLLFAPSHTYGHPDELRAFVDAAHARGLAVILDVVYNHLGPVGNVLPRLGRGYMHHERANDWGQSLNFDGPDAEPVRRFFLQNACQWLDEFRIDGLRLDALHAIHDHSPSHIVAEIAAAVHVRGGFVIGEDERNDAAAITPRTDGGWGLDAVWSDDFHHTIRVALTRQQEAHFGSYSGTPEEWATTLRDGWLYSGQHYRQWNAPRGTPAAHVPPERFVFCISNHDQVGNRPLGERLHQVISPEAYRAVSMLLCLGPYTPMLFMGQEWAARAPFPYFTDQPGEIGATIRAGRLKEFRERKAVYPDDVLARMPDPQAEATFRGAKLDWGERKAPGHRETLRLYRACLRLRAEHLVFQSADRDLWRVEQLGDVLAIRWGDPEQDWLLLFALTTPDARIVDDAFARPRAGRRWRLVLASNETRFGGAGAQEATGGENGELVLGSPGAMLLRET
ncbi:malto-oligosyltrehalose trehalohydrolase [Opitutus sp. ER46]|uniref:malto-oligosyltrehalose trehalohydrolase n=1 Tax=Opitutus sp. ER46 TaxID=2161864 RepID=UPI000D325475|nr:malto-oligosyltrehalose trehalohydrolase [Opitutus sp. ER46]PTX99092.1 malto-oligosyltrehalose trehalohydrolase [Opitutus sp. ER46]